MNNEPIDNEKRDLIIKNQVLKQRIRNLYWFSHGLLLICIILLLSLIFNGGK